MTLIIHVPHPVLAHLCTMPANLRLPAELILKILTHLWTSPLSVKNHRTLITSLPLTSHTLRACFLRVQRTNPLPKELHIVSQEHAVEFINFLTGSAEYLPTHSAETRILGTELESISLVITARTPTHTPSSHLPVSLLWSPMYVRVRVLCEILLLMWEWSNRVPKLRRVRVDWCGVDKGKVLDDLELLTRCWPRSLREVCICVEGDFKCHYWPPSRP